MQSSHVILRPTKLAKDERKFLSRYLMAKVNKNIGFFPQHHKFDVNEEISEKDKTEFQSMANVVSFELSDCITFRNGKMMGGNQGYEIFSFEASWVIGRGAYSTVIQSKGSLSPHALNYTKSNVVIKWQQHYSSSDYPLLKQRYRFTCDLAAPGEGKDLNPEFLFAEFENGSLSGLKIEQPIIVPGAQVNMVYSFTAMEYVIGDDMFNMLIEDLDTSRKSIKADLRIEMTIEILRAYQQQILNKGLIHRDIKLENLKGQIDKKNLQILSMRFLDFAFSKKIENVDRRNCGSPHYVAPEVFDSRSYNQFADIYSLGKLLGWLWCAFMDDKNDIVARLQDDYMFLKLFEGLPDILDNTRLIIRMILESMVKYEPSERLKLADEKHTALSIIQLINVRINKVIEVLALHQIDYAEHYAKRLDLELKQMSIAHRCDEVDPLILDTIQEKLEYALSHIIDSPSRINRFTNQLGVLAFCGFTTKKEIIDKMTSLVTSLKASLAELLDESMLQEIQSDTNPNLSPLLSDYEAILVGVFERTSLLTIDGLTLVEENLRKGLPLLSKLKEEISVLLKDSPKSIPAIPDLPTVSYGINSNSRSIFSPIPNPNQMLIEEGKKMNIGKTCCRII